MDENTNNLTWKGKAIGLLDLDAFFASVEILDNPHLAGKPVVVGGSPDKRGVVSTASYEARKYGIHSAMSAQKVKQLCPSAYFVTPRIKRYKEVSDQVMDVIYSETPFVEQVSIDEAFFDITPGRYSDERPEEIVERIQKNVDKLGVSASIGLSTSKSIAKIASDIKKPHGITIVRPGSENEFLGPLDIRALSGVGPAAEKRLKMLGINTLSQLAQTNSELLLHELGQWGLTLKKRAQGIDDSHVEDKTHLKEVKSVSNERTFSKDLTDKLDIQAAIHNISDLVGRRLRKEDLKGTCVTLKIKYDFSNSKTAQIQLPHPTFDTQQISHAAMGLLSHLWHRGQKVRLIGIQVSNFDNTDQLAMDLFDDMSQADNLKLMLASDKIKDRFGDSAITYGRELRFKDRLTKE